MHQDKNISQVYIDDIVIFSSTWVEHCAHIDLVLGRLKSAGLTANAKKCQWGLTEVEFLGHVVGQGKVSPQKEVVAKAKMKANYDKTATVRTFNPGEMVLVWKPGIHSKFGASWDGPFQVECRVSPVTYRIQVPGVSLKTKILHINMLKKWCTSSAKIHRVVSISDDESPCEAPSELVLVGGDFTPSVEEKQCLDAVLSKYAGVLSNRPGRTDGAELFIRTGDHPPVRSPFHRIPPKWRDQVKAQLDQLLEWGIIRPSTSPWASSSVC